jgi:lysozyme
MNIDKLKEDLFIDEGCKYEIYMDHLGYPTFGIGHLILVDDVEYGQPVGTPVSEDRVNECFASDIIVVLEECETLFPSFEVLPDEVQLIIANMMFNMGRPRLSKFKKFIAAVAISNWQEAANQMVDSRWYNQVPNRAERLVTRMKQVQ